MVRYVASGRTLCLAQLFSRVRAQCFTRPCGLVARLARLSHLAHLNCPAQLRAFFDEQHGCADVAFNASGAIYLDSRLRAHVAANRAANHTHSDVDVRLHVAGLLDRKSPALGDDLTDHFAVHLKRVSENHIAGYLNSSANSALAGVFAFSLECLHFFHPPMSQVEFFEKHSVGRSWWDERTLVTFRLS